MGNNVFALVDANNFYVSCERVFQPHLKERPVVVLSNNDGCIVARSQEVKDLGIKMGTPWFKVRELAEQENIIACSSNYTLYADMSSRMMQILKSFCDQIEVYSIDECFLDLSILNSLGWGNYAREMKDTIEQLLGLPTCVGIGATKTLAKLANYIAKSNLKGSGVFDFTQYSESQIDGFYCHIQVSEVWGIGQQYTQNLKRLGIHNVLQLKNANTQKLKKQFGIMIEKIILELNGISCYELEKNIAIKKGICSSRSFSKEVTSILELQQSISKHISRAAKKLRKQHSLASKLTVFIETNRFKNQGKEFRFSNAIQLQNPTFDTRLLTKVALHLLCSIFKSNRHYKKAGVILENLSPKENYQYSLFESSKDFQKSEKLMEVMDHINKVVGKESIKLLSEGVTQPWEMSRKNLSNQYTTNIQELIIAFAH